MHDFHVQFQTMLHWNGSFDHHRFRWTKHLHAHLNLKLKKLNFFFRWLSLDSLLGSCSAGYFTFKITVTLIRSPYSWPSWQPFPREFVELQRELNRIQLFCSRLSQFSWFDCNSVGRQQITSSPKATLFIYYFLIGCFFVVWLVMKKLYKQKLVGRNLTPMELSSCF